MELKTFTAQDGQGNALPSATIWFYLPGTTTVATGLLDASGAALSNPFTASATGLVAVFAPDGFYDVRVKNNLRDFTQRMQFNSTTRFLKPATSNPATRDDGSPLEVGDRYLNTASGYECIYKGGGWAVNQNDGMLEGALADATDPTKGAAKSGYSGRTVKARLDDTPVPKDKGAKADGTDDTAAFAALEAAVKGRVIDLGGATYTVSAIPNKNAYFNGRFKVNGFTRAAVLGGTFAVQPPHFHRFGGQLAKLKASLLNPLEQFTGIVFVGDSITWGSGNTGEMAPTDPRDGTLSDARDYFSTASYVNNVKRYIGEKYFFGAAPTLSNWPASPTGESIAEFAREHVLFPHTGDFELVTAGASMSSRRVARAGSITGFQLELGDGNLIFEGSHTVSFNFTGTEFTLSFGVSTTLATSCDYELIVDGESKGVFTVAPGEDGLTAGNDRRRTHTFPYVRNKLVQLKTKRRASQTTGAIYFLLEGIIINKKVRLSNQGINGATSYSYKLYNLPPNGFGDGVAVNADDNYVFCQLGTNDRIATASRPTGSNEFVANYAALLDVVYPLADMILMCANPAQNESSIYSFTMQEVRSVIYRAAKARNIDMIDNYAALQDLDISVLANDGLHPNQVGFALMSRNIINALEAA